MTGTVIWFNDEMGYGFLRRDDGGPDTFVHFSKIIGPTGERGSLTKDQHVEFEVGEGRKGPEARNVHPIADPAMPAA